MAKKRTLTIDHTKCGSSDSTDYPVLVSLSDTTLKDVAHGGKVTRSDGNDILFYSDSALTSLLSWELAKYDNVNGVIIAWVKIPTVSHSTDTVFYLKYGDSTTTTFQGGATGAAWNSGFKMVIHGGTPSTLNLNDSTSNGNNGTNSGCTAATGKINGGWVVGGGNRITTVKNIGSIISNATSHTMEYWCYCTTYSGGDEYAWDGDSANGLGAFLNQGTDTTVQWGYQGSYRSYTSISPAMTVNTWVRVMVQKSGSGDNGALYINGVLQSTYSGTLGDPNTGASTGQNFGNYHTSSTLAMEGTMEEARISNVARGTDYALMSYNNMNNPGNIGSPSFITVGSEGPAEVTFITQTPHNQAIQRSSNW